MSSKNLLIIGAIFLALLGYVVFTSTGNRGFSTVSLPALPKLTAETMERIELNRPEGRLVLEKKDGQWRVAEPFAFPAAKAKVEGAQRVLSEARLTDVITEHATRDADFGLTSATALGVRVQGPKKQVLALTVGKVNAAGTHTFVRRPGDARVYQMLGDVASALAGPAADWRSLQVYDFSSDNAAGFSITWGKKGVEAQKAQEPDLNAPASVQGNTPGARPLHTVWKTKDLKQTLSEPKVNQWLNTVSRLSANRIVDLPPGAPARPLLAQVRVKTLQGPEQVLEFLEYKAKEKVYWVRRAGESTVYELADYLGQNILKDAKDLL